MRFLRLVISLYAVLCVCITTTQHVLISGLPTRRILNFNPPGCELPCVLNIVPDVTRESQARALLAASTIYQANGDMDFEYQLIGDLPSQPFIGVRYWYPSPPHYVATIRISADGSNKLTTLGKILAAGYQVHRIIRSSYAMGIGDNSLFLITFDKDDQLIAIVFASEYLSTDSTIDNIYVIGNYNHDDLFQSIRDQWHGDDEVQWLGFTSVGRYRSERAIVENK